MPVGRPCPGGTDHRHERKDLLLIGGGMPHRRLGAGRGLAEQALMSVVAISKGESRARPEWSKTIVCRSDVFEIAAP